MQRILVAAALAAAVTVATAVDAGDEATGVSLAGAGAHSESECVGHLAEMLHVSSFSAWLRGIRMNRDRVKR